MPAGKRTQSNAMLYTLITFVGLFIVSTVLAIIYYIKFEEQRTKALTAQDKLKEIASSTELRKIGKIVGTKQARKSILGTMVDYLDETVYSIIGGIPEETSAEVKVDTANRKIKELSEMLAQKYPDIVTNDPNTLGLIQITEKLKTNLDEATDTNVALRKQLKQLQNRFDDAMAAGFEKEQILLAEKEQYRQEIDDIKKSYNDLKVLTQQTSKQQVQTLMAQLDEERAGRKQLNQQLLKTQAELKIAENKIKRTQKKLHAIVPPPDSEIMAFKPDGKIILIDDQTKIVHLNVGSDDHIYRGLTFSVYDKNVPIPKDGKGKAEIEVFNVGKNISAARITHSKKRRPIVLNDIIANLIWDSDKINVFVVEGKFDLDGNGETDYDGDEKIKAIIEKWGGRVDEMVSIETDFLVLGKTPKVYKKPTFATLEIDPMAMEKYEDSLQELEHYKKIESRAQTLSVPVFNAERFLHFIGYKKQSSRPGAF